MMDAPKTRAEAEAHRYGRWAGNERGWRYNPARCAYSVVAPREYISHQCTRKPGQGPDNLYCKTHAKRITP